MRLIITLLLLIPSLSWGEVIWLSCQAYEIASYKDGEVFIDEGNGTKLLYGLYNDDPIRLFVYPLDMVDLEKGNDYSYVFSGTRSSLVSYRYYLNRYTYELFYESLYEGERSLSSSSHCEIVDRIL